MGRGKDIDDVELEHHVSLKQDGKQMVIEYDGDTFVLDEDEVEELVEQCDLPSIYWIFSDTVKVVGYLHENKL